MSRQRQQQKGQALLVILIFLAAFLLLLWAGLSLASAAFLSLGSVRADTADTYALDAGVAYAIQLEDSTARPVACTLSAGQLVLGAVTVNVVVTPIPSCKNGKPAYTVQVLNAAGGRNLSAQISSSNAGKKSSWTVTWEAYQ